MQIATTNCPACGGVYNGPLTSKFITCEYCGTRYALGAHELRALGFEDKDGDGYDDADTAPSMSDDYASDTGYEPMDVFAQHLCEELMKSIDSDARDEFDNSRKIARGLGISDSDAILIHDDTLFKSGKNGFAITATGMYCREMGDSSAHFVDWDDFADGDEPELDDSYVRQDETSVCYLTGNDELRDELLRLYRRLWHHAQRLR